MVRQIFFVTIALVYAVTLALAVIHPGILWSLVLTLPLGIIGLRDAFQTSHTVLRNFPLVGNIRYLMETFRPEIQQYFIESNIDAYPVERELRAIVYQRAKGQLETRAFGTQRDLYRVGYEWAAHSVAAKAAPTEAPRVTVGGDDCSQPYAASLLNISAMSFGALSHAAIRALNKGAKVGGFSHNTGEGGVSIYHQEHGGDLVWQIGTGYFGCRDKQGKFAPEAFAERAASEQIKMIELKLSQGAKPGHGGVLPAAKVSPEIARARLVVAGQDVISPPGHSAFSSPVEMMQFIGTLRELSGGKPVGFKLCVGRRTDVFAMCKAMLETGILPDFITVDGGEGGTGAAPLEFSNSMGMPARDAWLVVHNALVGCGLRDRIRVIASGKIITGFDMVRALALGADICNSARGMMFALGCIQSLRCNTNHCPTGIATQNPKLIYGLHEGDKGARVRRFHHGTVHGCMELVGAMGLDSPAELRPEHIFRRIDNLRVRNLSEIYDYLAPGQLLDTSEVPAGLRDEWQRSRPDRWTLAGETGQHGGESKR